MVGGAKTPFTSKAAAAILGGGVRLLVFRGYVILSSWWPDAYVFGANPMRRSAICDRCQSLKQCFSSPPG